MSSPVSAPIAVTEEVRERFKQLASQWKEESRYLSIAAKMAMLQPYQRIIGMGMPVVPLILEELRRQPHHWFWPWKPSRNKTRCLSNRWARSKRWPMPGSNGARGRV